MTIKKNTEIQQQFFSLEMFILQLCCKQRDENKYAKSAKYINIVLVTTDRSAGTHIHACTLFMCWLSWASRGDLCCVHTQLRKQKKIIQNSCPPSSSVV